VLVLVLGSSGTTPKEYHLLPLDYPLLKNWDAPDK
jgi:hypothetical protein